MSTFVLVPGAGPVAQLLRRSGHAVHSAPAEADGRALASALEAHDLADVVLVGHAAAGRAIGDVASLVPGRVRQLVFLDGNDPDALPAAGPRVYVHCTHARRAPRVRLGQPGWQVTDLPAGARPLDEEPALVAALLEGLAAAG